MADFDDIDALLSSSLKKAAEPANSAGVADAIRSRVAAGDAGTAVAGTTAPGWGGGASGILTIAAPIALIVVAGVVGGALGASGVFGSAQPPVPDGTIPSYVVTSDVATAYTCPGGADIDNIPAGARVLAVVRNDDSTWLGVRDPDDVERTLWLDASVVVLDNGADTSTLPVDGCPEAIVTLPEPEPTEEPDPTPTPSNTNQPPPPPDTTPPTIGKATVAPNPIGSCAPAQSATVSVTAADNVGVAGVTVSWTGGVNGSAQMTFANGAWRYTFTPPNGSNSSVSFSTQARDAAGSLSPVATTSNLNYNCIG